MADRDDSDPKFAPKADDHSVGPPMPADATPESATAKASAPRDLPDIDSPSVSPAISEPVAIEEEAVEPKPEPEVEAANSTTTRAPLRALVPMAKTDFAGEPPFEPLNVEEKPRHFAMKPRHWRNLRIAASVAIGAVFGAIVGSYATGGFAGKPQIDVAAQEENKAMQQSVAKLAKEVTTLKANLDAANKRAQIQTASLEKKLHEQNERLKKEAADVTGSISAPQTTAAATVQAAVTSVDVPTPRPAPSRVATANVVPPAIPASVQPVRPMVIRDWSIRGASNGYIYVQGRFGDIYQIVPGAPLPGLGPVESIRRMDGRWVVKTPKGIIVSMRDRAHFE
ncbi:MAG: hypothetical protein JSR72_20795 [Proteobacteria bacterium]|nr:hypothetical protein [Pseudomonadota bacterium]